jgi:hypothetical protein
LAAGESGHLGGSGSVVEVQWQTPYGNFGLCPE